MADSARPARKKARLDPGNVNTSAPIYEPPKLLPASELFEPTLVTVCTYNEATDPEGKRCEKFVIPRGLLCARSAYFERMFKSQFTEADKGEVTLDEVEPWVFRVFVAWLYSQQIYYEDERIEPTTFDDVASDNDDEEAAETDPHADVDSDADADAMMEDTDTPNAANQEERRVPLPLDRMLPKSRRTGTTFKGSMSSSNVAAGSADIAIDANDEDDPRDPVTWYYEPLITLYLFADRYDCRDLRMSTLEKIQLKLFQRHPRSYMLPWKGDIATEVTQLPSTSPLFRLLADCYAMMLGIEHCGKDHQAQAASFHTLPVDFMSACFVAARRNAYCLECKACQPGGTRAGCKSPVSHCPEDALLPNERDPCTYHEHGTDDEERARCSLRWESLRYRLH